MEELITKLRPTNNVMIIDKEPDIEFIVSDLKDDWWLAYEDVEYNGDCIIIMPRNNQND